ncbi:MAG: trp operon repressor [Spirochaetaceae bacterium]|jgi:TrpR family trp operon transcriptional repressor|nr:trp operon repressor [Spirochaetaceae bacterium]
MLEIQVVNENLAEMSALLAETNDKGLIQDFLRELFTPAECIDVAARWALIKALNRGIPQRTIAKDLGLSLCKITRGSKELRKPDSALAKMLEKLT